MFFIHRQLTVCSPFCCAPKQSRRILLQFGSCNCVGIVDTRLPVPCAPGIPTNGSDKPFAELRLVQRGLDKLVVVVAALQVSFRVLCSKLAHCFPIFRGSPLPSGTGASFWVSMLSACSVCVSQWVWHCDQGSWHRIRALTWLVCALVPQGPPTLHPCKH